MPGVAPNPAIRILTVWLQKDYVHEKGRAIGLGTFKMGYSQTAQ
jgi:hypothetical protein